MRIVVTASGADLDAPTSPVFGRCPSYIFVDTETMELEAVENPAVAASGGAGIRAAQFVVERGAQAVVTGNMGPNAFNVFQAADVPIYLFAGGTVREAVEAYRQGQLSAIGGANAPAYAGMGMGGSGMGMGGGGMGMGGSGMGMGGGGMGRRIGRGMGMGRRAGGTVSQTAPAPPTAAPDSAPSREDEIAALKDMAGGLRKQLADVLDRIERLEKGD